MSGLAVEQREGLVVILGVVDESVVRPDYPLRASRRGVEGVDVALVILSSLLLGKASLVVAEIVAAYAFAVQLVNRFEPASRPAGFLSLRLGNKVFRELSVGVKIKGNVFL